MGEDKVKLFRKKLNELKTGKFATEIRHEKDRQLVGLILSFNEEEAEKCLQEYLSIVNLVGDEKLDQFLHALLKIRFELITDLDGMKAFKDDVTTNTPLGQRLEQLKTSSSVSDRGLKTTITDKISSAIFDIEKNPGKRTPVAKTISSNMLLALKTCYLKEKGQPKNLQDLMNFEPTSGPPTCEPPIPKAYLALFEKLGNASSEKEIRQGLEEHRKYVSITWYPYFRVLRYFRWAIEKRGDKGFKREIDIELYLQVVSQLLANSGKLQTSQKPFDDEEKEFFFAPLRKYTEFYQDIFTRFEVLLKEGTFTVNFDSVAVVHLLLLLEAKRRKVRLLPGQEFAKIAKALKRFKDDVEKKKQAEAASKSKAQSEPQKFFIDSNYAAAQGWFKVGQVIPSSVGVFTIMAADEYNRTLYVIFDGVPDVFFSMSYNDFRDRAWEKVPISVAESFKQFVGAISEIALKALGYSLSFFTGGLSALILDVGWDYAVQYGVESGVISKKTGFVLSLTVPTAAGLAGGIKGTVSKVERGLEGTTNLLSSEARAIEGTSALSKVERGITTHADEFDEVFARFERGLMPQGKLLKDLHFYFQQPEALAETGRRVGRVLPGKPGRTSKGEAVNPKPGYQSAHLVSQAVVRAIPGVNAKEIVRNMITRILPTGKGHIHTVFDKYWENLFRQFRQRGIERITAQQTFEVLARAARESGAFSREEAESMVGLIHDELFKHLGLSPNQIIGVPGGR